LSDVFADEIVRLADDYGDRGTALEIAETDHSLLRFYVPPEARWAAINGREPFAWPEAERPRDIGEHLTKAVRAVVKHNPSLSGVIDVVDFAAERNGERDINPAKLRDVVETFSDPRYRLGLADVQPDFLGRAYEYLLRKFAEGSGQSAGEFFTPTEVGFLMAHIMRPKPGEDCHDYACGSAGLLVKLQLVARELDPTTKVPLKLTGQERQAESYAVAQMNGIIHDMTIELARGDTMINPKFRTADGRIKTHDIVVANPMWNQPFAPAVFANDPFDRFRTTGGITTGKGDWAWLQHTLACMNDRGRAAVVLDTGAVTRGSGSKNEDRERNIRRWFVEQDLIEGVILLPDNLFYNTPAAGVIIVLNRRKTPSRKNRIVLVNAGQHVRKGKPKNYIPKDAVRSIATLFANGDAVPGEIAVVSTTDAAEADYNLNPSHWVTSETGVHVESIRTLLDDLETVADADQTVTVAMVRSLRPLAAALGSQSTDEVDLDVIDPQLPPGWTSGVLGDYIERPEYGHTASATSQEIGPRFLRITDIQDGIVNWNGVPYCACDAEALANKSLRSGDLVVARIGATTGKSFFVESSPRAVFASYLIRVRSNPDLLLPKYLYYFMQTDAYWDHINRHKGDRLKGGVNIPILQSLPMLLPPVELQKSIVDLLDSVEKKLSLIRRSRVIVDDLYRSALKAFVGVELTRVEAQGVRL
jgi:type I restriction enzyme M protein